MTLFSCHCGSRVCFFLSVLCVLYDFAAAPAFFSFFSLQIVTKIWLKDILYFYSFLIFMTYKIIWSGIKFNWIDHKPNTS